MKKLGWVGMLLSMSLFMACSHGKYGKMEKALSRDTLLSILSDSSLFSNMVEEIISDSGKVYFCDMKEGHVVCLNPDFSLKGRIGRKGEGPGDLVHPTHIYKNGLSVYILDDGVNSIKVYSESGEYQRRIHFPADMSPVYWSRFFEKDSLIYFPSHTNSSVVGFDFEGKTVCRIGKKPEDEPGGKLIQGDKAHVYTIGTTQPLIEKYTYEGERKNRLDYGDVPFVEKIIGKGGNTASAFNVLVKDAYLEDGHLYLLILDKILHVSLGEEMAVEDIYMLPHGLYNTFCPYKGGFLLFNIKDNTFDLFSEAEDA